MIVRIRALLCLAVIAGLMAFMIGCGSDNTISDLNTGDDDTADTGGPDTTTPVVTAALVADHSVVAAFDNIPSNVFSGVADGFSLYYGHTSHGSQLVSGLNQLYGENDLYDPPSIHEYSDDLGHSGDTSWVPPTRTYLNDHPACDIVVWSWCGGCSDNTEAGIDIYLAAMNHLETDYPDVVFIYMTGHLDGTGIDGNLYARNNQIRAYCAANDKILFDFADIESYDPDGTYYPDASDACEWCSDWCLDRTCCDGSCAHSHCFNCYLKGKAFWWLLAGLYGWEPA